jgi:hypothetical protein
MTRRDAFSDLRGQSKVHIDGGINQPYSPMLPDDQGINQPLDLIPTVGPKKKRDRSWEKARRSETVTYRGIPREYQKALGMLAESLSLPRDELVRYFLEFSVKRYRNGQLSLIAYPKAQRMTLYPGKENMNIQEHLKSIGTSQWLNEAFSQPQKNKLQSKPKKDKARQNAFPRWEIRVTYRIPIELKVNIKSIADENFLPMGEVVWYFVDLALKGYFAGDLLLETTPKIISNTLFPD